MIIKLNGEEYSPEKEQVTIQDILKEQDVKMPETVTVQLNGQFVKHEDFMTAVLRENDEVEFLYLMAGGEG